MKKHKNKIIIGVIITAVLVFTYWWGGNSPDLKGWDPQSGENAVVDMAPTADVTFQLESMHEEDKKAIEMQETPDASDEGEQEHGKSIVETDEETKKDESPTETVPEPIEQQETVISDKEQTCILSVRCDTILNNMEWLDDEKTSLVPKDGIIYKETTVTFYEGESVFDLLVREMKKNRIHMEFENTPLYNSAYIEAIANLYEFDCGELSGWMYSVNDVFPNYGCSRYQLKAGDKVEWVYTCDLGNDVGGGYGARNGM